MQDACEIPGAVKDWPATCLHVALLSLLVVAIYFSRMTLLPACGEESRWAHGAVQMLETGDWIVPRQQRQVFVDRPPMASWTMAAVALVRGEVDLVAIRLPSALAMLGTTLIVYFYARTFLTWFGALAAGAMFATLGQVLQLGQLGENEALFTMLVSGSLLAWHAGYAAGRSSGVTWSAGYALAALAALQKGPQAPVYFVAVTGAYLLLRRDWRWLLGWGQWIGASCFVLVIAAWEIPFWRATNLADAVGIWTRSAAFRVNKGSLLEHMATFPLETFACLLPWSALAVGLLDPRIRRALGRMPAHVAFLLTSVVVTYPSVWLVSGSRGRYFMPLYPCIALMLAWIAQRCVQAAPGTVARRGWDRFLLGAVAAVLVSGIAVAAVSFLPQIPLREIAQPAAFAVIYLIAALATAAVLFRMRGRGEQRHACVAVMALASYLGLSYTGAVLNAVAVTANDLRPAVASLKEQLPRANLVSFGPIFHRFAFAYEAPIRQIEWPSSLHDVPEEVEYFCYDYKPGDTEMLRDSGRGFYWTTTPGTLPLRWEEVAVIPCGRRVTGGEQRKVIVGRILRDRAVAQRSNSSAAERRE
ncbi:MAG: glycosyltransferase family 39 protein [Pirellulales bacterium]